KASRLGALLLVAMFAVWANTHGGFLAGLVILTATLGIEGAIAIGATTPETRRQAWVRVGQMGLLLVGTGLATLLNPYGIGLYRWTFHLRGDPYFMELHQEWRSPDFRSAGAMRYELLILLFPLVLTISARRASLVELGLSVLWLHFALTGFR